MTTGSQDWSRWYPIVDEKLRARGIDVSAERATPAVDAAIEPRRKAHRYVIVLVMVALVIGIAALRTLVI